MRWSNVCYSKTLLMFFKEGISKIKNGNHKMNKRKKDSRRHLSSSELIKFDGAEEWSVKVFFGTPPQPLSLIIDTGSSNLWVTSKDSSADKTSSVNAGYNHTQSSTYVEDGGSFSVEYGDGGVEGWVSRDVVSMQTSAGFLSVDEMPFGELKHSWSRYSNQEDEEEDGGGIFRTMKADGVLGLGFDDLNTLNRDKHKTFIDELYDHKQISNKVFGIFYGSNEVNDKNNKMEEKYRLQSYVNIGGDREKDPTLPEMNSYETVSILEGGYWMTRALHVGVSTPTFMNPLPNGDVTSTNDEKVSGDWLSMCRNKGKGCTVLIDSGSSYIGVPSVYYQAMIEQVTKSVSCVKSDPTQIVNDICRCDDLSLFPRLDFDLPKAFSQTPTTTMPVDGEEGKEGDFVRLSFHASDYLQPLKDLNTKNWGKVYPYCYVGIREMNNYDDEQSQFQDNNAQLHPYNSRRMKQFGRSTTSSTSIGPHVEVRTNIETIAGHHHPHSSSTHRQTSVIKQGDIPNFVLGSTLLKTYYTEFDLIEKQISFARPLHGNLFQYTYNDASAINDSMSSSGGVGGINVFGYFIKGNKIELFTIVFLIALIVVLTCQYLLEKGWNWCRKYYQTSRNNKIKYMKVELQEI